MNKFFVFAFITLAALMVPGCQKKETAEPVQVIVKQDMDRESGPMQQGVGFEEEDLK